MSRSRCEVDTRAVLAAVVIVLALAVALHLPAGAREAAALEWLVVTVPAVLAALGRPVTRG
jgi:hypothetical protein